MEVVIGDLEVNDLTTCFLDTLSSLAEVRLTPAEAAEILSERRRAGIRTYAARAGAEVVGTASLLVERKFIHGGGRVGHIEDVAVRRGFQKQGIGAALVRHATEQARKLGCYKVILSCFEKVAPFYEELGFRRHDLGMRIDVA
jgi:glucosamine-phosphate N-acetyltransferase